METLYVVSAFLRDGDKALLLQRGPNRQVLPGFWEMPGGKWHTDRGLEETLTDCVQRETGLG